MFVEVGATEAAGHVMRGRDEITPGGRERGVIAAAKTTEKAAQTDQILVGRRIGNSPTPVSATMRRVDHGEAALAGCTDGCAQIWQQLHLAGDYSQHRPSFSAS